ncbi:MULTISPECIES: hypothetical protein [unclassified Hyphomonas]|uniref:hypothetical protein n=1 Tax=unclassified Hyphomonas TaxID=2630699 RepID=UPI000458C3C1|nr:MULTISPECIES: hypothetical protein [unclassified Hyphomonas]KCZ47272.1 hypothetical protein HY17_18940 [Hyphomonas sp. CY54-11-8]
MTFVPIRTLVFFIIGFPVGFILTALVFAVTQTPISAPAIFPWALGLPHENWSGN